MAIDFPNNPSDGDTYVAGDIKFTYNAANSSWKSTPRAKLITWLSGDGPPTGTTNPDSPYTAFVDLTNHRMYWCIQDTTDENVWYGKKQLSNSTGMGSIYGYANSGKTPSGPNTQGKTDKFPFASDENSTYIGDLAVPTRSACGHSSLTHGYTSAGRGPGVNGTFQTYIKKTQFSTESAAADVGDLTYSHIETPYFTQPIIYGYVVGGNSPTDPNYDALGTTNIDKFPFATDEDATSVGDLHRRTYHSSGQASTSNGYVCGGGLNPNATSIISKIPFASESGNSQTADLALNTWYVSQGHSTLDYGYVMGGISFNSSTLSNTFTNVIQKFPFATDEDATSVGTLATARRECGASSSTEYGYTTGGYSPPHRNIIEKMSWSSEGAASDVGDLSSVRSQIAGTHY
jgi:hypothetical protein